MVTPRWRRGWVAWLLPAGGEGGLHGHFSLGKLVFGYFPLRKLGFRVSSRWGRGWVAWLLPIRGEGGLHGYSPLGERVGYTVTGREGGCMVTPY